MFSSNTLFLYINPECLGKKDLREKQLREEAKRAEQELLTRTIAADLAALNKEYNLGPKISQITVLFISSF